MHIQKWTQADNDFVKTRAAEHLSSLTDSSTGIVVLGEAGLGKTTLIHHEALRLQNELDYEIVPVTDLSEISNYHKHSVNQVFIVDDFWEDLCLNETNVNCWKNMLKI